MPTATTNRWSTQQRRVIDSEGVTFVGIDEAGRPVVEQKERWGDATQRWALKGDGDPAEIRGAIAEPTTEGCYGCGREIATLTVPAHLDNQGRPEHFCTGCGGSGEVQA